jgi:uncharacterized protein (DUF1501 family)
MKMKADISRRHFLQLSAGALAASSVLTLSGPRRSLASSALGGYQALVCLYLNGGNDGHNFVVPISGSAYSEYAAGRQSLALPLKSLLPLNGAAPNGVTYGLHPSCKELQTLFNTGKAAIVGNVGPLMQPTTAAQAIAGSVPLPPQIFSHLNQSTEWQTAVPQAVVPLGWAGKIADYFVSQGNSPNLAYNISLQGSNTWQIGQATGPYSLGVSGPAFVDTLNNNYRSGLRMQATQALIAQGASDPNLFVKSAATVFNSAISKGTLVNNALNAVGDLKTKFPAPQISDWGLSQQLHEVARVIKAQSQIGDARQMFFVEIGGFDTHMDELATQVQLLSYVSQYVDAFWNGMIEIGMQNNVTLFTMSDFGRTLTSNGSGADHGWGNHHIVIGGAVAGGKFFGTMPNLTLGGPDDFGGGRLVPSTSADQYAATLANWFGVPNSSLNSIFINLPHFSVRNLGFFA